MVEKKVSLHRAVNFPSLTLFGVVVPRHLSQVRLDDWTVDIGLSGRQMFGHDAVVICPSLWGKMWDFFGGPTTSEILQIWKSVVATTQPTGDSGVMIHSVAAAEAHNRVVNMFSLILMTLRISSDKKF